MEKRILDAINEIGRYCQSEQLTLSVAESVTSGYLQYLFSQAEYASSYFQGGITLYNNYQKFKKFDISHYLTASNNGVSSLVSQHLAKGTNLSFGTNLGIGITGFAHKDLEYNISEPHCYIAIALEDKIIHTTRIVANSEKMFQNQMYFAFQCIHSLYDNLKNLKLFAQ